MSKPIYCSVEICDRDVFVRGLCVAHYDRQKKFGDVRADVPLRKLPTRAEREDISARILARCTTDEATGCIEWQGYRLRDSGYGTIRWHARDWVVHRAMWTYRIGPIPTDDDWTLDHLCRNRVCVNTDHLEVVTRAENSRRGGGLLLAQARNMMAVACKNGHDYTPENTRRNKLGHRVCLQCRRDQWAKGSAETSRKRRAAYAARRAAGLSSAEARLAG